MDTLIITDHQGTDIAATDTYDADIAFGSGENDFEITVPSHDLVGGQCLYFDGTEYGGIIDESEYDTKTETTKYKGRTWHGILVNKIIRPLPGADYYTASGELHSVLRDIIRELGLADTFKVDTTPTDCIVNHQFNRYQNAYEGLLALMEEAKRVLVISRDRGGLTVTTKPQATISNVVDSDLVDLNISRVFRPPNHLVCLGAGELKDRHVIDLYADKSGNISKIQTYTGLNEIELKYDFANSEDLEQDGIKKLKELQSQGGVKLDFYGKSEDLRVGDKVFAREVKTGTTVTSAITKKIVKGRNGFLKVSYEIGQDRISVRPSTDDVASQIAATADQLGSRIDRSVSEMQDALDAKSAELHTELDSYKSELDAIPATIAAEVDKNAGTIKSEVEKKLADEYATKTALEQTATEIKATAHDELIDHGQKVRDAAVKLASDEIASSIKAYSEKADATFATVSSMKQTADAIKSAVASSYATKESLSDTNLAVAKNTDAANAAKAMADTAKSIADQATKTANDANSAAIRNSDELTKYQQAVTGELEKLQGQVDAQIETWFEDGVPTTDNKPANEWDTDQLKANHEGDLYFDRKTGKSYRWLDDSGWKWQLLEDTDVSKALAQAAKAQDTADGKRRVFIDQPKPPYDAGDLWTDGADLYRCLVARPSGAFTQSDWQKATDYTNDEAVTRLADHIERDYRTAAQQDITDREIRQSVEDKYSQATKYTDGVLALEAQERRSQIQQMADSITSTVQKTYVKSVDYSQAMDNLKDSVGSRNLLKDTANPHDTTIWKNLEAWSPDGHDPNGNVAMMKPDSWSGMRQTVTAVKPETEYTYSLWFKSEADGQAGLFCSNDTPVNCAKRRVDVTGGAWTRVSFTFTTTRHDSIKDLRCESTKGKAWIGSEKLELGSKATEWAPAPEDTQAAIDQAKATADSAADAAQTADGNATAAKQAADQATAKATAVEQTVTTFKSEIQQNADGITALVKKTTKMGQDVNDASAFAHMAWDGLSFRVSKDDLASEISATPKRIHIKSGKFGWEAENSTMEDDGCLTIQGKGVDKWLKFTQGEMRVYRDNNEIGRIGGNCFKDTKYRGIEFELESDGTYMAWCTRPYAGSTTLAPKILYTRTAFADYSENAINFGCDVDFRNHSIFRPQFRIDGMYGADVSGYVYIPTNSELTRCMKLILRHGVLLAP